MANSRTLLSKPAWLSAPKARPAPAWALMLEISKIPDAQESPSQISTTKWLGSIARPLPDNLMTSQSPGVGGPSKTTLGFGCGFADLDLDGRLDLVVANGHIDDTVRNIRGNIGYAQPPHLFLNLGKGKFQDVAGSNGGDFAAARV